ncbi:MAG TPA: apolipoprotein N-acyltransferase [Acidobacteriota bacterium]|nr:apolipoprotein N-acyltransferase [Acidobacteriota bacterium]
MMRYLLPVASGLLLAAAFPLAAQGWLAWVALVPLMLFVFNSDRRLQSFWGGLVAGAVKFFILLLWIPAVLISHGDMPEILAWFAYVFLVLFLACYPAAACLLVKHVIMRRGSSFFLLFPFVWISMELVQSISPFGGFPWLLAGYTQSSHLPIAQIADITGVFGVSFLILAVNTALAWFIARRADLKRACAPLAVVAAIVAAAILYGMVSLERWNKISPEFRAAMLQGNISVDDSAEVQKEKILTAYPRMAAALEPGRFDLLVLPESPSPLFFQHTGEYRLMLEELAKNYPLGLVFNNSRYEMDGEYARYFNSAFFLDNSGAVTGVYDKMHLVPFGEYIPLRGIFFFLEAISREMGEFEAGDEYRIILLDGRPANAIICFEAVFPRLVRRFVDDGSGLILNLTNDGWYGDTAAPHQHLAIASYRAVENRRYLLRATNSGISAIVAPTGKIYAETDLLREATSEGSFTFIYDKTVYSRYGDAFVFVCVIILLASVVRAESAFIRKFIRSGGVNARRS